MCRKEGTLTGPFLFVKKNSPYNGKTELGSEVHDEPGDRRRIEKEKTVVRTVHEAKAKAERKEPHEPEGSIGV